ncbi:hypothetical protein [uncultured Mailhella sp.]|uniref:hypothetical protein n=1 Tax=uncultured Mailhella sp. TaxID=1981031 RepID=UPI0025CCE793|nr:hypothetical protein [uncultured Mailhella sp.]
MEDFLLFEEYIRIPGMEPYRLVMTDDFQVVLELLNPPLDDFQTPLPGTAYVPARNKILGMLVYRRAARILLHFLKTHPIRYFWFGTGAEPRRGNLYLALAVLAESYGYTCTYSDDCNFYFTRNDG